MIYLVKLQLGWHPVAVIQYTFTRKQYVEQHNRRKQYIEQHNCVSNMHLLVSQISNPVKIRRM